MISTAVSTAITRVIAFTAGRVGISMWTVMVTYAWREYDAIMSREKLLAACNRLLAVESEVVKMPKEQRDWFFGKDGHRDCFTVAHALKQALTGYETSLGT